MSLGSRAAILSGILATLPAIAGAADGLEVADTPRLTAVDLISQTADSMCAREPAKGANAELAVAIETALETLFRKLADFEIRGSDVLRNNRYQKCLQTALIRIVERSKQCRSTVLDRLIDVLLYPSNHAGRCPEDYPVTEMAAVRAPQVQEQKPYHVLASRLFAGPKQYPPKTFAAYGILAFHARASSQDVERYGMICEAYAAALPHTRELPDVPPSEQMVTVWPIDTGINAYQLNRMMAPEDGQAQNPRAICDAAVEHYGLVTALGALQDAELAGVDISNIGPYLLAWSPSSDKGKKDVLVLVSDLSRVTTYQQAQEILLRWTDQIQDNPDLWEKGWDVEKLQVTIRLWADEYGSKILALFGAR